MKKRNIVILVTSLLALILITGAVYHITVDLSDKRKQDEWKEALNAAYTTSTERYAAENELHEEYEVDIAFLGDSITAGYDIESYYPEYSVVNRGIGGDTTYGLKNRLAVSALDIKPKACVMLIGTNNLDTMFEDYEEILISFKENLPETKVILVSLSPTSGSLADRNELLAYNNVKIKLLAEKYGYEYVDIYSPLFDLETGEMKDEYTPDGLHHTAEGYRVITEQIKPAVNRLLGQDNAG